MHSKTLVVMIAHQVPGAVGSSQVTLDVRVEDLHGRLDEAAAGEMLVVLDERQPRLQQLVVGLHVNHVVLVQLSGDTGGYLFSPEFWETTSETREPGKVCSYLVFPMRSWVDIFCAVQ